MASSQLPRPAASQQLAIDGGPRAVVDGQPAWPLRDEDVRIALEAAYADGSWGRYHGPHCDRLTEALAAWHDVPLAMLCCSGTFAVELALRALEVGPGDEVVLAGYDFSGNFRAVEAVGARPMLVDVDADNWNLDPGRVEEAIGDATKAVVASHLHGGIVPMRELTAIGQRRGLAIVEDASQAVGATVEGRPAGTWGAIGVLSFGGSKLLTAGRGGALLMRDATLRQRAKIFCERGNHAFPLSELQAAVLLPQLDKLRARHRMRADRVAQLLRAVEPIACLRPFKNRAADSDPAYFKLGLKYDPTALRGRERGAFIAAVQAEGVALDAGFRGFVRRGPRRCRTAGELMYSEQASERTLVLHHPVLLEPPAVIEQVAGALAKVANAWSARG